jgi:putative oxidoreductase
MNIVLWILQILLAIVFFAHGLLFFFPPAEIAALMNQSLPRWFQLFLGLAEVLAAIGLTLPAITRVQPSVVPWAAVGIMIVMVSATYYHIMRGESPLANLILLAMAAFVAYMRYLVMPIAPRGRATDNVRV